LAGEKSKIFLRLGGSIYERHKDYPASLERSFVCLRLLAPLQWRLKTPFSGREDAKNLKGNTRTALAAAPTLLAGDTKWANA
jgi:hypothetical protein